MGQIITGIIVALVGGGAVFGFIQFLIQRKDNNVLKAINKVDKKIDVLENNFEEKINSLNRKIDDVEAKNARIRILNFSEEIQRGVHHSKESFDQVHSDIDDYENHCEKYPDYPNSRAEDAITNIQRVYLECLKLQGEGKHAFL